MKFSQRNEDNFSRLRFRATLIQINVERILRVTILKSQVDHGSSSSGQNRRSGLELFGHARGVVHSLHAGRVVHAVALSSRLGQSPIRCANSFVPRVDRRFDLERRAGVAGRHYLWHDL